jgi:putative PIN family toxin of toxin-antitoxin system
VKAVVDTNCLIVSIPRRNPEYWLYRAFRDKAFDWVISNEVLTEYEEELAEFYSPQTANLVVNILLTASNVIFSEPFFKYGLIAQDPDDNKFADLAIAANVDFLVTNDRHFRVLKTIAFPTVNVVPLAEFQQILKY